MYGSWHNTSTRFDNTQQEVPNQGPRELFARKMRSTPTPLYSNFPHSGQPTEKDYDVGEYNSPRVLAQLIEYFVFCVCCRLRATMYCQGRTIVGTCRVCLRSLLRKSLTSKIASPPVGGLNAKVTPTLGTYLTRTSRCQLVALEHGMGGSTPDVVAVGLHGRCSIAMFSPQRSSTMDNSIYILSSSRKWVHAQRSRKSTIESYRESLQDYRSDT